LHCAVLREHEAIVRLQLEAGTNIEARDSFKETALHSAASEGNEAMVPLLLEVGTDIKARDNEKRTALHQTTRHLYEHMMQEQKGFDYGPLQGCSATVTAGGVDTKVRNSNGETDSSWVSQHGHKDVVRLLQESGIDI
jgi:ankyrin repeat protein